MTELFICAGTSQGTWMYLNDLIASEPWEKIFVVTTSFGTEHFKPAKQVEFVVIDEGMLLPEIVASIKRQLDRKLGIDAAVNLISGSGKMHMAVLSALMQLGISIRLVALTPEGVKEI